MAYTENLSKPNMWSMQGNCLKIYIMQCSTLLEKKFRISYFWKVCLEYKIIFIAENYRNCI